MGICDLSPHPPLRISSIALSGDRRTPLPRLCRTLALRDGPAVKINPNLTSG